MSEQMSVAEATEVMLDAILVLVGDRDDEEIVFPDIWLRLLAEHLSTHPDVPDIAPCTAGQFRERWRSAKARLAQGDGP